MILKNDIELIGDFLGSIPVMNAVPDLQVVSNNKNLFSLVPNIKLTDNQNYDKKLDLQGAFHFANARNLYMTQTYFHQLGLEIPFPAPKPILHMEEIEHEPFDFLLAPYSRSLPPEQKWRNEHWVNLVVSFPNKRFGLLGTSKFDSPFINQDNCEIIFDKPLPQVAYILSKAKCLISVVTGLSHMAFATNTKNILLNIQGSWGVHPDAISIHKHVQHITPNEVIDRMKEYI